MSPDSSAKCPFAGGDERKSAQLAAVNLSPDPGARVVGSFGLAREIFRHDASRQFLLREGNFFSKDPDKRPVIFLDGEVHRRRRATIARFFTPKAVTTRHHVVIERTTDRLLSEMRAKGRAQ